MGQRLVFTAPRQAIIESYEEPQLQDNQVRVRTLYTGISTGTELCCYRGTLAYFGKKWNASEHIFLPPKEGETTFFTFPFCGGYEEIGEVTEIGKGVTRVKVGDRVYGVWGHRTSKVLEESYAAARLWPADMDPLMGAFLGIIPTALNGTHDANIHLGETVVVFGLGPVGQLVAQFARLNGGTVIGVDPIAGRRELALKLGAHQALDPTAVSVGEKVRELTGGRGADVCMESSGFSGALHEAIRSCAYSAKVIAIGCYQGAAKDLYLGDEFHHNRINIVGSQASGVSPDLMYRWDKARQEATVIGLMREGRLRVREMVTHLLPFDQGPQAFAMLDKYGGQAIQVVLQGEE